MFDQSIKESWIEASFSNSQFIIPEKAVSGTTTHLLLGEGQLWVQGIHWDWIT